MYQIVCFTGVQYEQSSPILCFNAAWLNKTKNYESKQIKNPPLLELCFLDILYELFHQMKNILLKRGGKLFSKNLKPSCTGVKTERTEKIIFCKKLPLFGKRSFQKYYTCSFDENNFWKLNCWISKSEFQTSPHWNNKRKFLNLMTIGWNKVSHW